MSITLYDILGISSSADLSEIKSAYKKLAKKHHPDKNPNSNWHEEQFKRVNQAYQILSDPTKRSIYNNRLEYEEFQRKNPKPRTSPTPTPPKPAQKKSPEPKKHHYEKPPITQKKRYEITLSDKRINLFVVGYYLIAILFVQLLYSSIDYFKIRELMEEAISFEKNKQYYKAISCYSKILGLDKKNSEVYEKRAIARIKASDDIKGALRDFSYAIEYSDNPANSLLFQHAKCCFILKNYKMALNDLTIITASKALKPDSSYFYKAESHFRLQDFKMALQDYSTFISLFPTSGEAHWRRGFCYLQTKEYKKALPDYSFAITWKPENAESHYFRGIINFALKDYINGCTDLTNAFLLGYTEAGELKNRFCD